MSGADYVELKGLAEFAQRLSSPLEPIVQAVAFLGATEAQDFIAPYPQQPAPADPDRWYERGYGPKWRRKDGSVNGRKESENLGRKWSIKPLDSLGVQLTNVASYAPFVHAAEDQAKVHQATGWKTDKQTTEHVVDSRVIEEAAETLVNKAFGA